MFHYYEELIAYCIKYRHDRVMAALEASGRCREITDIEYFGFSQMVHEADCFGGAA